MSACFVCSKVCLFALNFIFLLIGSAFTGLGIWILVDGENWAKVFIAIDGQPLSNGIMAFATSPETNLVIGISVTAFGAFVVFVTLVGIWGSVAESRCLLITYSVVLSFVVVLQIAAVVVFFGLKGVWQKPFEKKIEEQFSAKYSSAIKKSSGEPDAFAIAADLFMVKEQCCGTKGPNSFAESQWKTNNPGQTVPAACCLFQNTTFIAEHKYGDYTLADETCPTAGTGAHPDGCLVKFWGLQEKHLTLLIAAPTVSIVFCIICLALAIYMAKKIGWIERQLLY